MREAKGPGLEKHMMENGDWKPYFTGDPDIMDQAKRQSQAAGDRIVEWYFAEKRVADRYRELFSKRFTNIIVLYVPPEVE